MKMEEKGPGYRNLKWTESSEERCLRWQGITRLLSPGFVKSLLG